MRGRVTAFILTVLGLLISCNEQKATDKQAYVKEIDRWHQQRIERLKKSDGWLTLAGLLWLREGPNTFGSAQDNDLVFPEELPAHMGTFILTDTTVRVSLLPEAGVTINETNKIPEALRSDLTGHPDIMRHGTYSWYVIRRSEKTGIRIKNSASPVLRSFTGINRFPVDPKWRVRARLVPHDSVTTIAVPNVLGQINKIRSPGRLVFEIDGQTLHLDPTGEPGDKEYFIIFGDASNGQTTYGAGRFLVVPAVDENGETWIDFNKAYNPPCVFTPYATCPLPPQQNILSVEVPAGEKVWGHH
ncbi:MAG: DUF1684 domain-containing protein [Calditrichaeota bacterium]|nr:MAG: DUF1684 domain-containing protein [Calditrichota bacterium]